MNESASAFACRLRRLSSDCSFGQSSNRETLLRDIFVTGVFNDRLGEKLLAEDASTLTFDLAIRKAEAFERARQERASSKHDIAFFERSSAQGANQKSKSFPKSNEKHRSKENHAFDRKSQKGLLPVWIIKSSGFSEELSC